MRKAVPLIAILVLMVGIFSGCFEEENKPPIPNLEASSTYTNVYEDITFSANESYDEDGKIIRYFWNFGDGTNKTGESVNHEYEEGGNYTVTLIVTDDDNTKAIEQITIYVNELPTPFMNISLPVYIHEVVYFNANESYDLDGHITEYFWDFGDGTNDTGINVSHVYTKKDTFAVTLSVTDDADANAATSGDVYVLFRTYEVNWKIGEVQKFVGSGNLDEGNSVEVSENITRHNITQLRWNLTWNDDIKFQLTEPNDMFMINITSPKGYEYAGGPEADEQIVVFTPKTNYLNKLPQDGRKYQAESAEILETYLAENFTTSEGTGDWLINITLTEAGGVIELPFGEDSDDGNDWDLSVNCHYYMPVITKK